MVSAKDSKTHGPGGEFDRVLLDVVVDVLRRALGDVAAETVLLYMERIKGLKRGEIPRRVEEFSSNLNRLLGSSGPVLEKLMIKRMCFRLQLEYDAEPDLTFPEHVEKLRESFE